MVDRETFSRRLAALNGYLERLRAFKQTSREEFCRAPALHDLAERYLHLAMECVFDLGNHCIADRELPPPETNRDTFTRLEDVGELPPALAARLRAWAGFRNILVHQYLDIDHQIAWRTIQEDLGDLEAVSRWAADKLD
jgi:uncharacterized protein YutE (UPF0331/DUF86 family)